MPVSFSRKIFFLSIILSLWFIHSAEAKATAAMSMKVYKKLKIAQDYLDKSKIQHAIETLNRLKEKKKLSHYEQAQIGNLLAYSHYLKNDYKTAVKRYEKLLTLPGLTPALEQNTLKTLSQLCLMTENYQRAITLSQRLIKRLPSPDRNTLMVLGQAYFQLKQYKNAKTPIKQAIALTQKSKKTPKENDWLILKAIHHHLKEYQSMVSVLKRLIRYYPKVSYVKTLAAVYGELKQSKQQLSLYEALYEAGQLNTESELNNLASFYLMHKLPYKAAMLLQKSLDNNQLQQSVKNYKLLSQAWTQAGEYKKALLPLSQAAKLSGDKQLYIRLGHTHFNLGNWKDAEKALTTAVQGKYKNKSHAWLLLGMTRYRLLSYDKAKQALNNIVKHKRHGKIARQWIGYIDQEVRRRKELLHFKQSNG